MEVLPPISYHASSTNWFLEHGRAARWTPAENKMFEYALAVHDEDTPNRWHKVAAKIPGKTMEDVMLHYRELELDVGKIEAGLIPTPGYTASTPFTLEVGSHLYDEFKDCYGFGIGGGKRSTSTRPSEQERKKGIPWTEEEHKLFLRGLKKYGKGDWRSISRDFVVTRTPIQVASHAQKYYIRQLSGGKDKRRASIHDVTTVNLSETRSPSPDDRQHPSLDRSTFATLVQQPIPALANSFIWNQPDNGETMDFIATHRNMCLSPPPIGIGTKGDKAESKIHYGSSDYGNFMEMQNSICQLQSGDCYYWHG